MTIKSFFWRLQPRYYKSPQILVLTPDKQFAIGVIGKWFRFLFFNYKWRVFTGDFYKLVKKHDIEEKLGSLLGSMENQIIYDPVDFTPYEYELILKLERVIKT